VTARAREGGALAIDAHGLTKQFGTFRAVDNATLQVGYGEIYGLLGANGAGKTTIIKMLCGLLAPTVRHDRARRARPAIAGGIVCAGASAT
jgi:ABC-type uncharacterized transport system ATPase subunit